MKRSFKQTISGNSNPTDGSSAVSANPSSDVETIINRYSGMSEEQLMQELISATNRQKADGTFDRESVQKGVDAVLPMLNDAQKKKLFNIISRI